MNAPAPDPSRRSVAQHMASLLGARSSGMGLRIVASLIVARIAGPEAVGFVAWIGIFSMYALWLTGGVVHGAERLVPIRRAQSATCDHLWRASAMVTLLAGAACVLLGTGAWVWALSTGSGGAAWKYLAAGLLSGISLFVNYVSSVFTAEKRFPLLNRLFFIEGVLWWVFLPLAWWGAEGLTARTLLVALLPAVVCLRQSRLFHRPAWQPAVTRELAVEGLPILFSRFLLLLAFGLDRTFIAFLMDDLALGHYVLATSVISLMRLIQYAVSRVLTPHLGEVYGRTRDVRVVARTALQCLPPLLAVLVPGVFAGWFLMEPLTRWLLPAYLPGVGAGQIALLSGALASVLGTNVFFVTIGRQKTLIAMLLTGLAIQAATTLFLFRLDGTIESVAWGFVAGALTNVVLVVGGVLYCILRPVSAKVEGHEQT